MLTLTESKIEILLKIGEMLGNVHTGISIVVALDKIGVLNAPVLKTGEVKTVEVLIG